MVARAIGAGNTERANHVAAQAIMLTLMVSAAPGCVGFFAAPFLLPALGAEEQVTRLGTGYLRVDSIGIVAMFAFFVGGGILRGAGDTLPTMIFSVVSPWIIQVPLAILLSRFPVLAETGIWWAGVIAGFVQVCMTGAYLAAGRWKHTKA